jgi:hypothetical protein
MNHLGTGGSCGPRFGVTLGEIVELDALVKFEGKPSTVKGGEVLATVEGVENDRSAGFIGGVLDGRLCGTGSLSNIDCTRPLPMAPNELGT